MSVDDGYRHHPVPGNEGTSKSETQEDPRRKTSHMCQKVAREVIDE